jgi:hypothetical protein
VVGRASTCRYWRNSTRALPGYHGDNPWKNQDANPLDLQHCTSIPGIYRERWFARLPTIQSWAFRSGGSWDELWSLIGADAPGLIRGLVVACNLDPGLADDLGQELLRYHWKRRAAPLRGFPGGTATCRSALTWGSSTSTAGENCRLHRRAL